MTTATTPSKPSKAFYAILNAVSGSLTKIDNEVLFFAPETGDITMVLNGAEWMEDDGHTCMGQSRKHVWYPVNGHCTCADASKAEDGYCKHRLSKAIYRRAGEVMHEPQPQISTAIADAPATPQ